MLEKINVTGVGELDFPHEISIEKPSICPCCHTGIDAKIVAISNVFNQSNSKNTFAVLFRCPICGKYFFEAYIDKFSGSSIFDCTQIPNLNLNIPEEINKISPKFKEIYTQSLTADFYGLSEITGIGLRKSIEFLVKDYLINYKNQNSDKIKNMFLGKAIELIDNPKIKSLTKATVWLGNDETHYQRVHKNKDINDMKKFINALIHFISFELTVDEAESFTAFSISK